MLNLNSAVMALKTLKIPSVLPKLIVFDLDMCLWSPEMYELNEIPISAEKNGIKGKLNDEGTMEGITAVKSGTDLIKLFPASLKILQDFHNGLLGTYEIRKNYYMDRLKDTRKQLYKLKNTYHKYYFN